MVYTNLNPVNLISHPDNEEQENIYEVIYDYDLKVYEVEAHA